MADVIGKIPTLFERDWAGDRSRVLDSVHVGCEWAAAGEGVATVKLDGTCAMVRDGRLFKRRELRDMDNPPAGFEEVEQDYLTAKRIGWVPVGDGPEDKYFREAWERSKTLSDGTYELIGPKVQGNPENWHWHELVRHGTLTPVDDPPRTFDGLRDWLGAQPYEGIVWHHSDGRMAKIKARDFGVKRARALLAKPA